MRCTSSMASFGKRSVFVGSMMGMEVEIPSKGIMCRFSKVVRKEQLVLPGDLFGIDLFLNGHWKCFFFFLILQHVDDFYLKLAFNAMRMDWAHTKYVGRGFLVGRVCGMGKFGCSKN